MKGGKHWVMQWLANYLRLAYKFWFDFGPHTVHSYSTTESRVAKD